MKNILKFDHPFNCFTRKEWMDLKQEYLTLQKSSMSNLKKTMLEIKHKNGNEAMEVIDKIKEECKDDEGQCLGNIVCVAFLNLPRYLGRMMRGSIPKWRN